MGTFGGTTNFNKRIFERQNQEVLRSRGYVSQVRDGYGNVVDETAGRAGSFNTRFAGKYGNGDYYITSRQATADDMHANKYHNQPSYGNVPRRTDPVQEHYRKLGNYYKNKYGA